MLIDLDALCAAPLTREPFTFTVVKDAIRANDAAAIRADFPTIADSGLMPVEATRPGPRFRELIEEMKSDVVARAIGEKFGVDLVGRAATHQASDLETYRRRDLASPSQRPPALCFDEGVDGVGHGGVRRADGPDIVLGTRPIEPILSLARSLQQAKDCGLQRDRYGTK